MNVGVGEGVGVAVGVGVGDVVGVGVGVGEDFGVGVGFGVGFAKGELSVFESCISLNETSNRQTRIGTITCEPNLLLFCTNYTPFS
jgi:hypothetical protein